MARAGLGVVLVLVVGAAAFWAGRETLQEPETVTPSADSSIVVEVVNEEVGRVITLTTTVTRPETPLAMNALQGVVTHVAEDGERGQGDVLYTVGDTPVVLVAGDTPFWRDLAEGASGDDVQQVQEMLNAQGANLTVDGDWDFAVTSAVEDWQDEHGAEVTGEFALGQLVATPTLPVSVSIDESMAWPGASLTGGEAVAAVASGEPSFAMEVTRDQAEMMSTGTQVTVRHESHEWDGVIAGSTPIDSGMEMAVTAPDGGQVCGADCSSLPPTGEVHLLTDVAVVPPESGPVVPAAALTTRPDGSTTVEVVNDNDTDERRTVTVLTVADGLAVVDGVEAGDRVRVFGAEQDNEEEAPEGEPPTSDETPPDDPSTAPSDP